MQLDVRIPLGLLLTVLGVILLVYGFASDPAIYVQHSLGQNLNLRWGAIFLLCGTSILFTARKR
jgi:hypothetical protein